MKGAPVLHWPKLFEGWMLVSAYRRFGDGDLSGDGQGGGYTSPRNKGNGSGGGERCNGRGNSIGADSNGTGDGSQCGNSQGNGYGRSV